MQDLTQVLFDWVLSAGLCALATGSGYRMSTSNTSIVSDRSLSVEADVVKYEAIACIGKVFTPDPRLKIRS
jgi:excinuclease UvrABC ATPase subunit